MKPKTKPNLVVVGDITVDVLMQVESIPGPGEDAVVRQLTIQPGGSAANCAAVAARLGSRVSFVGVTGQDIFDAYLRQDLTQFGVDIQHLRQLSGSTAIIIAMIVRSGERTFFSYRGAAATQDYGSIPASILKPGDILHVSGYALQPGSSRELVQELIAIARKVGAKISLDPSFHFAQDLGTGAGVIFRDFDFLYPNRDEALLLTNSDNVHHAARLLTGLGVRTVLLTLGGEGCLVADGDDLVEVPAYKVSPVVDMTGAGDAFAGGFLAAMTAGCALLEAVSVGQAAAAMIIAEVGGHAGAPRLAQLRDFARQRDDAQLLRAVEKMELSMNLG